MARVFSPDPTFCGVCAGLNFEGGVAESGDLFLLGLLAGKGFAVDMMGTGLPVSVIEKPLQEMPRREVVEFGLSIGADLSGLSDSNTDDEVIQRIEAYLNDQNT